MRICMVTPHLPPEQAANALLPAELGTWMAAEGDTVHFVAHPPVQAGAPTSLLAGPVTWVPRRARRGVARALRLDLPGIARAVSAALDEAAGGADVIHLHSNGLLVELAAAWALRRRRPYVLTMYGTEIWHYRRRWPVDLFTRAYRGAGHVACYSRMLMDRAAELGLGRDGLSTVYPAVADIFMPRDVATRAAWRAALGIREPKVILNVKRLHELAGQRYLLEAFARIALAHRDVRLVICGTGALRESLELQARGLDISERVTFTGLVPNDVVAQYAAVADVFALPSLLEALPTVAIEALASGTPVVSADHPGGLELQGIFGDDVSVVPREDADALAAAIERALLAPRRVRGETLKQIESTFRPGSCAKAYRAIYEAARRPQPMNSHGGGET